MNTSQPTGYVRTIQRATGPVYYAHVRLPDGRRLQRRLGRAWTARSRPPAGYLTRQQAQARVAKIVAGEDVGVSVTPTGCTFGRACDDWLAYVEHDRKRAPATVKGYSSALRLYLRPRFGDDTLIDAITVEQVDAYRAALVAEGRLSDRTINLSLALLHGIFKRAQRQHGLSVNPAAGAERQPCKPSGDFQVLAPGEVHQLAAAAVDEHDAALFTVAAFSGLRLGELAGLRWHDVDFAKRLIHVRVNYCFTSRYDRVPKSGKVRSVVLIDQAARALDGLSRRDDFTADDDRVFCDQAGDVLNQDRLRTRYHAALDAAGLKRLRFHDLRHSFGTLAVQVFPISDVKAFMGHSNISTTMRYIHHTPQHDAADKLTALVAAAEDVHPTVHRTDHIPA